MVPCGNLSVPLFLFFCLLLLVVYGLSGAKINLMGRLRVVNSLFCNLQAIVDVFNHHRRSTCKCDSPSFLLIRKMFSDFMVGIARGEA
jgi:hypothetical protein